MEYYRRKRIFGAFLSGALMATAVLGYFLFGSKNARRNRQKVEDWIEDAKFEVTRRVRKIRRLSREKYYDAVDSVLDKYSQLQEIGKAKADGLRDELKRRWDEVKEEYGQEEDYEDEEK